MSIIIEFIAGSPILLLFLVVGVGYLLGTIRVFGFSLGPAAVLFTGLFVGAVDPRLRLPDLVYILGLVLFVYTIGLQSGPTFFASFGKRALRANGIAFVLIVFAAVLSVAAWHLFSLNGPTMVGVFSGALTNTPALAASIEAIKNALRGAPPDALFSISNAPVIGYSVAYPFGVIGVLLGFYFFGRIRSLRPTRGGVEAEPERGTAAGPIVARTFAVVNRAVIGKSAANVLSKKENSGIVLSRLRRGTLTTLVYADTVFEQGDLVVAVGTDATLKRALRLFGKESPRDIHTENQEFDFRRIDVSSRAAVGKTIGELNIQELLDATITRIRRGDVDFVPAGDTVLERGDRIRVITWSGNVERVARFFGDSVRVSSETDFLSLSVGLVLGLLLGMIPLPLPGGSTFTLGFAGGPLIVGLVLGRVQRTGPITWGMPFSANVTLRQIGLVLFLGGIGTKAGDGFLHVIASGGWLLLLVGAVITALVTVVALAVAVKGLRLSYPAAMGLMSGIQTQPACLAYATERSGSDTPNVWYAAVYPVSMITKIILAQVLVGWML
jgi:putative transport protein